MELIEFSLPQSTIRHTGANIRGKSVSEANLLSTEAMTRHTRLPSKSYRRSVHDLRTMSEFGSPLAPHYPYHHPPSRYFLNLPLFPTPTVESLYVLLIKKIYVCAVI